MDILSYILLRSMHIGGSYAPEYEYHKLYLYDSMTLDKLTSMVLDDMDRTQIQPEKHHDDFRIEKLALLDIHPLILR